MKITRKPKRFHFRINIKLKHVLAVVIMVIISYLVLPYSLKTMVGNHFADSIYKNADTVPPRRVAIVFGAGLDGTATAPSLVLEDRIQTAVELYKAGKVQKIIMSGDNRFHDYNEPQVMIEYAKRAGVPEFDLQPDYAGRRTYDSCYRAKQIFGVTEAILVTQAFHLPRAMYTCNALGIDVVGVEADKHLYQNIESFETRDSFALLLAFWDIYIIQPDVVLGEKINI